MTYFFLLQHSPLNSVSISEVVTKQNATYKLKLRLFYKAHNLADFDKFSYLLNFCSQV